MSRILSLLLLLLVCITGCENPSTIKPSGKIVKVGFVGQYYELDAVRGEDALEGILVARKVYPLLDNGDRIEIIAAEDNGNDAEKIRKAMQKLVQVDGVSALLLGLDSDNLLRVAEYAESLKTPMLALIATHPDVISRSEYISQLCFDDSLQGSVAALFVRDELLIDRAAIFIENDDPYSRYLGESFQSKFIATGGQLVGLHDVSEISQEWLRDLQEKGADILYLPISPQYALKVLSIMRKLEWSPEIMTSDGLVAGVMDAFPDQVEYLEGVYATELFTEKGEFVKVKSPGQKTSVSFNELFDGKETTFTRLGVEGYAVLIHAMNLCESPTDKVCVNRNIRSTEQFEGTQSRISIDENGKATRPVFINTVENGALKSVVKVY